MNNKIFFIIFSFAFALFLPSFLSGQEFDISRKFVIDIYEDGKITEEKAIVYLTIIKSSNNYFVAWRSIMFMPSKSKKVMVFPNYYSTLENTITNITVKEDYFSFDLKPNQESLVRIIGSKKSQTEYFLEGVYNYWDYASKKMVKREWKSTNKKSIILPFQEVD